MNSYTFEFVESPEYKALYECKIKQCKDHQKLYKRRHVILEEISRLTKKTTPDEKTVKKFIALAKEYAELGMDEKALVCSMKKCSKELAQMQIKNNKEGLEMIKEAERMYESLKKSKKEAQSF